LYYHVKINKPEIINCSRIKIIDFYSNKNNFW